MGYARESSMWWYSMGLLQDTWNCGLRMRRECRERFPRQRGLAIPTCITARAWRMCRDACRDRKLAVCFEVGGEENVPGIPRACATRNFAYLVRGPNEACCLAATAGILSCSGVHAVHLQIGHTLMFDFQMSTTYLTSPRYFTKIVGPVVVTRRYVILYNGILYYIYRFIVLYVLVTHNTNHRGEECPAEFPPYTRVVTDHVLQVVIETVHP